MSNYVELPVPGGGSGAEQRVFIEANLAALNLTSPSEGFIGYTQDTDLYYYYSGAAWVLMETRFDHNNLLNYVADEHVAHSSVSITTSGILSGGGDITTSRNISLLNSDVDHDQTTNFVANEHIDHTTVTLTAGVGLSGGGDISASRTIDLDINELVTAAATQTADFLAYYDADGLDHNKVLISDLFGQNLTSTSSVTFSDVNATIGGIDYSSLTQAEVNQLANIGLNTISNTQWGYLGAQDQSLATTDSVTFSSIAGTLTTAAQTNITSVGTLTSLDVTNNITVGGTVDGRDVAADGTKLDGIEAGADVTDSTNVLASLAGQALAVATINTGNGAVECYAMNQDVETTDAVTFAQTTLTGTLNASNGSATSPSIRNSTDTNTGWYWPSADTLTATTGGSNRFQIDNNGADVVSGTLEMTGGGQILANVGTAAAPGLSFGGDTNTGIFSDVADRLSFSVAGVERVRVTSSGLGIINGEQLFIEDGSTSNPGIALNDDTDTGIYSPGVGQLAITVGSSRRVQVNTGTIDFVGTIRPTVNNSVDCGTNSLAWRDVYGVNAYTQTSDEREKTDIENSDLGLDFVNSLRPVSFKWRENTSGRTHYGLIAQEFKQAILDAGKTTKEMAAFVQEKDGIDENGNVYSSDKMAIRYSELMSPTIKAIQELTKRIEDLESK